MAGESKSGRANKPQVTRKQAHRRSRRAGLAVDPEQSARLLIMVGVAIVVAIALGFLVFGYWYSVVRPRNRTVLEADGIKVSYSVIRRRMGYELAQNLAKYQRDTSTLGEDAYTAELDEITLVTRAEKEFNATLTDAEFQNTLFARLGLPSNASGGAFTAALKRQLDQTGLREDEYRRMVRASALKSKVMTTIQNLLPATVPQAKVEVIVAATQDEANAALARVKAGEDWATVAKAVSKDSDVATTGGLHDYAPQEAVDPAYENFAFTAQPGEVSAVLPTNGSAFYVVRLVDRTEQPLKDTDKTTVATKRYSDWLMSTQQTMGVKRNWDPKAQSDALAWVGKNIVPKIAAQQAAQRATAVAAQTMAAQQASPTAGAGQPTAAPGTPAAAETPAAASPQAPSQPVAPGNGQ